MSANHTTGIAPAPNGRPHPRLVHVTPAATLPPAPARHPDERLTAALLAAKTAGFDEGERLGYLAGWRAGVGQALLGGMLVGAAAMYAGLALWALIKALP